MALEYIPTRVDQAPNPATSGLVQQLREQSNRLGLDTAVVYYGWPKFTDYESNRHSIDLAIIGPRTGVIFIKVLPAASAKQVIEATESISQAAASAFAQLVKSPLLRTRARQLKVSVLPIIYAPGFVGLPITDVEVLNSENALLRTIQDLDSDTLTENEFEETRSILEGAKALVRQNRRVLEDKDRQRLAAALSALEDEIASFDQKQRHVALTALGGPTRIRGLAGSGKTVILAMKAALAHLDEPKATILVTFYTRSLRNHLTRLITRFHRHFGDGDPNWKQIHIHHGWGRKDLPGVLREASIRAGLYPMTYSAAANGAARDQNPFDFACRALIGSGRISSFYDLILIDEGQDFPGGFYELCFHLAKGARDKKNIVWAYDELQNIFDVKVRTPDELFGIDKDGQPRISLSRSLPTHAETNDFVLPKCYRNQRDVLVLAHATGFGIYGQPVQMLQDKDHWEDVGYEVEQGVLKPGNKIIIRRPDRNNPSHLKSPAGVPLIELKQFQSVTDEVNYCADEFAKFIENGLQPEDLMAIAIDDRAAKSYLSLLAEALAARKINSNNIIADRYSEPAFTIEGKCTLTTVYRAKGNEAAVVAVLGCDAVPLQVRSGRNRLFTAFTRTKAWLRITGMEPNFGPLAKEIGRALELSPKMEFVMPDPAKIEMIQRDLSERDARIQRARAEMERLKEQLGLTDDELKEVVTRRGKNARK